MKCDRCRYAPTQGPDGDFDDCGYFDEFGITWKDGSLGCTVHPKTLEKNERDYCNYLGQMGTEMGLEMDFEQNGWDLDRTISRLKHFVGLDTDSRVYHRHGKAFYKAYRNYWYGRPEPDFDHLSKEVFGFLTKESARDEGMFYYSLTPSGLSWLSRKIGVTIKEDR